MPAWRSARLLPRCTVGGARRGLGLRASLALGAGVGVGVGTACGSAHSQLAQAQAQSATPETRTVLSALGGVQHTLSSIERHLAAQGRGAGARGPGARRAAPVLWPPCAGRAWGCAGGPRWAGAAGTATLERARRVAGRVPHRQARASGRPSRASSPPPSTRATFWWTAWRTAASWRAVTWWWTRNCACGPSRSRTPRTSAPTCSGTYRPGRPPEPACHWVPQQCQRWWRRRGRALRCASPEPALAVAAQPPRPPPSRGAAPQVQLPGEQCEGQALHVRDQQLRRK